MKNTVKLIKKDCFEAMAPAWLVSTLETVLAGILTVWISALTADFTNAILQFNKTALTSGIWKIILCVFASVFVLPLLSYICNIIMLRQALKHDRKVMGRFLHKKYNHAMSLDVGEAQSRLENDPNNYRISWMEMMTQYASLPIVLLYLMYKSLNLNRLYTLITITISAVRIFIPVAVKKLNTKYDKESRDYSTELRKCEMNITLQPHFTVMLGIKRGMLNRIDSKFRHYYKNTGKKSAALNSVTSFSSSVIDTISTALVIMVGAVFVSRNIVPFGTVAAMLGFFSLYNSIINSIIYIIRARPLINTLISRLLVLYEDDEMSGGKIIEVFDKLSAVNLSYKYKDTLIFEPVSFSVYAGEKIAICGENGSGKTTLLHILCGLNCDYTGSVTINNEELSSLSPDSWRGKISLAMQEPFLFPGTVIDNLTFGGLASKEDAMRVLEDMGIAYLADRNISVKQDSLSVGEKQRISLSRLILKNTPVIFMDEPNNNLDADSLRKLKHFISSSRKTIIFISHEDSLTALADRVITVKKLNIP